MAHRRNYDAVERLMILVGRRAEAKARWCRRRHQAKPSVGDMVELMVAADGVEGAALLKAVRGQDHICVYWPGRGEEYLAGPTFRRVTMSVDARRRLSIAERDVIELRTMKIRMKTWARFLIGEV